MGHLQPFFFSKKDKCPTNAQGDTCGWNRLSHNENVTQRGCKTLTTHMVESFMSWVGIGTAFLNLKVKIEKGKRNIKEMHQGH